MLIASLALAFFQQKPCCPTMVELTENAAFVASHPLPVQTDFTPKYGHMQEIAGANSFVVPPSKGTRVGILMIHEWWGLNNQIKMQAEKLHEDLGYGVVAVDLYHGNVAKTREEATKYVRAVKPEEAKATLKGTVFAIRDGSAFGGQKMSKVGTIGYCFGGGWSFNTALSEGSDVNSCVIYYGQVTNDPQKLEPLKAPVLGIFANKDQGITPAVVTGFADAMKAAKKHLELHRYDAVHGFANPSNPEHDPVATADAWKHTISFYKRTLGR